MWQIFKTQTLLVLVCLCLLIYFKFQYVTYYFTIFYVFREKGVWWNRQLLNSEFIPPMDKQNQVLLDTLKTHKMLLSNRTPLPVNPVFKRKFEFLVYKHILVKQLTWFYVVPQS